MSTHILYVKYYCFNYICEICIYFTRKKQHIIKKFTKYILKNRILYFGIRFLLQNFKRTIIMSSILTLSLQPVGAESSSELTGIDPTSAIDSTSGFRAILDAASKTGKKIVVPKGRYLISAPLYLDSHTHIACQPGAIILPTKAGIVFGNRNADVDWQLDTTPSIAENQTDVDISVDVCTVDTTNVADLVPDLTTRVGISAFRFRLMRGLRLTNNRVLGDPTGLNLAHIPNAFAIAGVADAIVQSNYAEGVYNGFGAWGGSRNFRVSHNTWSIAPNLQGKNNPYSCSNINGVGTVPDFHQTTHDFVYDHNTCYLHGGRGQKAEGAVGYNNSALSSGSAIINGRFLYNTTIATGHNNTCYVSSGHIDRFDLIGNYFEGCDAQTVSLTGRAKYFGDYFDPLTTTEGSPSVVVSAPNASSGSVSVGNWAFLHSDRQVGGLLLNGIYEVTAVAEGSFVVDARKKAGATAHGGGQTRIAVHWGAYRNSLIAGNVFKDCNSLPDDGALVVEGPNNIVMDNIFKGGVYGAKILVSSKDCCSGGAAATITVFGNFGPAGTGVTRPTGGFDVAGDGNIAYERGYGPR